MVKNYLLLGALFLAFALAGCTSQKAELGSEKNPVKLHFVPSVDAKVIDENSKAFKDYLEKNTPYKFEINVPQSYIAVVESFGTKKADIAVFTSFGYILAHEKYGAEARMTVLRHGSATYQSQFIARTDSKINSLADIAGKKVAFVDPSSASGYLLPLKTLRDKKIEPKETMFAMKHDNVVAKVYNGEVDVGATFYSPPEAPGGEIQDARRLVKTQYPDVEKKVKIIDLSDPIPNDPIVFRKDMPEEMKAKIAESFLKFVQTDEGKKAFQAIYGVTDLKKATDADYDSVRGMLTAIGKSANEMIK